MYSEPPAMNRSVPAIVTLRPGPPSMLRHHEVYIKVYKTECMTGRGTHRWGGGVRSRGGSGESTARARTVAPVSAPVRPPRSPHLRLARTPRPRPGLRGGSRRRPSGPMDHVPRPRAGVPSAFDDDLPVHEDVIDPDRRRGGLGPARAVVEGLQVEDDGVGPESLPDQPSTRDSHPGGRP